MGAGDVMKIFIALLILLSSCALPDMSDTPESIMMWVYDNIEYVSDKPLPSDQFQIPRKTLDLRTGDCDDFAILFMWLLYQKLGIKAKFVILKLGDTYHASVAWEGKLYESTGGFIITEANHADKIIEYYSYDSIMAIAVFYRVDKDSAL